MKIKRKKHVLGWSEKTLLGMILTCVAMVVLSIGLTLAMETPQEKAEHELKRLADVYYTEYLYPQIQRSTKDVQANLKQYDEVGIPQVYLRRLLHYNNDEQIGSSGIFEAVGCNTNYTGVRYFPKEPYGPRDYEVFFTWHCDKMDSN